MNTENTTNHIQHAVGLAYRFGIEKGLSRKGEEKLALLKDLEDKQQHVQDSIMAKQKADERARLLAEQLEREKEAKRLAAEEKARKDAEETKRAIIQNEIDQLGNVYFALNSSYLTSKDKELLDKLVGILKKYPDLQVEISAHTDSRGSDKYNQWLSERRAERTVKYILSKNISQGRIMHDAFGETKLTNECSDEVICPEDKHRMNRRVSFIFYFLNI
jgi:outer membrane protein OmpA-like peptidoglycan-associated protein